MTIRFGHLAQRLFNRPLMIEESGLALPMAALADRLGVARIVLGDGRSIEAGAMPEAKGRATVRDGYDVLGGVAVIEVSGTLVHRLGTLRPYCGMTGYDGIRQNLLTALGDPMVRAVALHLDSPGGECAGCFDLVDTIAAARGIKPLWGICDQDAYSAAYAIASACDRITVPRTGGVGSIGVITMLVDYSGALDKAGIVPHFIHYGERKAEEGRAQMTGVKADLLARVQADIDRMGELFVGTVARNRGLSADAIRAQQAACFMGDQGVAHGLADAVLAPDEAFRALIGSLD